MRTRPIGVVSALIAAAALVAAAGPASSRTPGTAESVDAGAFRPLLLDRRAPATISISTPTTPDAALASEGSLTAYEVLRDPGTPGDAPTRPRTAQPAPPLGIVPKRAWRTAEYSWYGPGFYGSGTACGQTYTSTILGVAHRTLPCGTRVTLRNPRNGRTITVRVIDRGPYVAGRMWDLSKGTCTYLGNCFTSTIQYRLP